MKLLLGDCLDKLKELDDNSIDSIVTDPPYGLSAAPNSGKNSKGGFMGKKWDYDVPSVEIWKECLRVLKPGGHLLSFAGSRTYHRMAVRIEDAGFEIRDQIMWIYGSGFPKSMDISKQLDKIAGAKREVIGKREHPTLKDKSKITEPSTASHGGNGWDREWDITAPATDEAKEWNGWGTALKPAHEPIVMARKPLSEKTVVDNVLEWGTGGINIDGCRIETDDNLGGGATNGSVLSVEGFDRPWMYDEKKMKEFSDKMKEKVEHAQTLGRFPANIIFDEEAGKLLDEQSGISKSSGGRIEKKIGWGEFGGNGSKEIIDGQPGFGDVGGASRFFYCPKTSKSDRNEGLDEFDEKRKSHITTQNFENALTGAGNPRNPYSKNNHPTVKPTDLMLYLIRLVTKKSGTILDPFMGSGSTGKAAIRGGFDFVGIEREDEYFQIAKARIEYEKNRPVSKPIKGNRVEVKPEVKEKINQFFG
jgi:site-specific DNA-methyltransferase (adenine-specific)